MQPVRRAEPSTQRYADAVGITPSLGLKASGKPYIMIGLRVKVIRQCWLGYHNDSLGPIMTLFILFPLQGLFTSERCNCLESKNIERTTQDFRPEVRF